MWNHTHIYVITTCLWVWYHLMPNKFWGLNHWPGMFAGRPESSWLPTNLKLTPSPCLVNGIKLGLQVFRDPPSSYWCSAQSWSSAMIIISINKSFEDYHIQLRTPGCAKNIQETINWHWSIFGTVSCIDRFTAHFWKVQVAISWNHRGRCYISRLYSMKPCYLSRFRHTDLAKNL